MTDPNAPPSLGEIALRYGTINRQQMDRLMELQGKTGHSPAALMHQERMATPSQISLIQLIQEFLVLKQQGERFGQIAVKRGFATRQQVNDALKQQLRQFRQEKRKRMIGDILVESGVITQEQRQAISREQQQIQGDTPMAEPGSDSPGELALTPEERRFLVIRNQDRTFAAAVIQKGLATQQQVDRAMDDQIKSFKRHRAVGRLGDIMVAEGVLTPDQCNRILADQEQTKLPEKPAEPVEQAADNINISLSQDAMEAWAELSDPGTSPASLAMLKGALAAKGVVHGILRDEFLQCCLDRGLPRFILARGDLPVVPGQPRVKYLFDPDAREPIRVERGDPLAKLEQVHQAAPGLDVLGSTLDKALAHRTEPAVFNCGKGARMAKDGTRVFAASSGTPFVSVLGRLHVLPAVNVLDDADMRFGAIEPCAALSVSGTLTGAYPVKAGTVKAREIRDTRLESLGDITVSIGITNAVIKTQGSVRARYIHNTTIEAFGDVIVDHEILDSTITISGRCLAQKSRIIASTVSARGGVSALGVGSDVTEPCHISVARETHLILALEGIEKEVDLARQELNRLEKNISDLGDSIDRVFEKMVRLKRLYDTAKRERARHQTGPPNTEPRTAALLTALDKKMASAFNGLKHLNHRKQTMAQALENLKQTRVATRQTCESRVQALGRKRFQLLAWSRQSQGLAQFTVNGPVAQGTRISGPFSSTIVQQSCCQATFMETCRPGTLDEFEMVCNKIKPFRT